MCNITPEFMRELVAFLNATELGVERDAIPSYTTEKSLDLIKSYSFCANEDKDIIESTMELEGVDPNSISAESFGIDYYHAIYSELARSMGFIAHELSGITFKPE